MQTQNPSAPGNVGTADPYESGVPEILRQKKDQVVVRLLRQYRLNNANEICSFDREEVEYMLNPPAGVGKPIARLLRPDEVTELLDMHYHHAAWSKRALAGQGTINIQPLTPPKGYKPPAYDEKGWPIKDKALVETGATAGDSKGQGARA
jgi:hypothetical protein